MKNPTTRARRQSAHRVVAVSVTAALALTGAAFGASSAQAAAALTSTPDLSKVSTWQQASGNHYDFEGTTLPGTSTKALRMSSWVDNTTNFSGLTQLHTPSIAASGPRVPGGADYDTFTANFTLSAADYATQPDLAIEISPDTDGNRAGGDLLLREEADSKLTLTNFHIKADSTSDEGGDWEASTAAIDFTHPVTIKYVAQFDPDANSDIVKVYVNGESDPIWTGSTFEKYHAIEGEENQTVDGLSFRAVARQVDESAPDEAAWTTVTPDADQLAALKGKGFYFSGLSYAVSNTAPDSELPFATPTITGTAAVGKTLTATTDTDDITNVNFAYKWLRSGVAIKGATAGNYTLVAADKGKTISAQVTATKPGYTTVTHTSAPTVAVAVGTFENTSTALTGAATVGHKLVSHVSTSPAASKITYQWYSNGKAIAGATNSYHSIKAAEAGTVLTVVAKASASQFTTLTITSAPSAAVAKGVLAVAKPTLSGSAKVGATLTAKVKAPAGSLVRYAFFADGEYLQYSTSNHLKVPFDAAGTDVTVEVSASKAGYVTSWSLPSGIKHIAK